ncbi:MAG TPA: alkaline phosphatase family protein [Polyangia bacterium]
MSGCSDHSVQDTGDVAGSIGAQLQLEPGINLDSVSYTITGPGGFSRTGTLSLQNSTTLSAVISALPAGNGYTITISGTASDGVTTCLGTAMFNVVAHQTTPVAIHLTCHEGARSGSVALTGTVNICPAIDGLGASPAELLVGASTMLTGAAHDTDHGPSALTYAWTADSGTLSDATVANPTFTCTAAGTAHLTLTVSDGDPAAGCADTSTVAVTCTAALNKVNHVVVIYLENHSFDNLYGDYPGAVGRPAVPTFPQLNGPGGAPFTTLAQVDMNIPMTLPNLPFDITQFVPANMKTIDLVHRYYQEQQQIDGGKMDLFAFVSDAKGLSMGYYPTAQLPVVALINQIPTQATVMDHFFHAAFGGSFLNHHWLIAAATPVFPNAPAAVTAVLDASGHLVTDGFVTPDGFAVNTSFTVNTPHPTTPAANLVPNQTNPTIGDRLSAAGLDWAWYAGGWNDALAGHADPLFQYHHQPFAYYANYADGTAAKAAHLKDETDFMAAAAAGTLPPVSFIKPLGPNNEHPGYADLLTGENHTVDLVNAVRNSPNWSDAVVIITYDEHGGFWDHVVPPTVDRWGPGSRVPSIIFSPFAAGGVDSTSYDTTAILKLIEKRWSLAPLSTRDAAQNDLDVHALKL